MWFRLNPMYIYNDSGLKARPHISTLAIGGVSSPLDSFLVAESFVLRIKFSVKNSTHQKSAKR